MASSRESMGVRGILFDLDGVLYNADEPIPRAAETVEWVREKQIPHLFVTNTTSRPRSALVEKLAKFEITAGERNILTPSSAAVGWLRSGPKGKLALFLREAAQAEFREFPLVSGDADSGASYVVVGDLGDGWDYATLNRAFRLLHHNPEAELIALGMTRYWQATDGISLDVAPFVVALEHATGRKAVVLGKPAKHFFEAAAKQLELSPGEILMIGDDIRGDVGGAQAAGLKAALVKTGKFSPKDLETDVTPDAVFESVAELPAWWSG